jgi:hypothetical protein
MNEVTRRWKQREWQKDIKPDLEEEERILRDLEQELVMAKRHPELLKRKGLLVGISKAFDVSPLETLEVAIKVQRKHIEMLKRQIK